MEQNIFLIIIFICGLASGNVLSDYSSILININPDCTKPVKHSVFSKRNITICLINACLWTVVCLARGLDLITFIYMLCSSILLIISVIDFAVYEIPPQFNIIIAVLGLVVLVLDIKHWYIYLIGSVTVSGLFIIIEIITKGKGMGGGDTKLMAAAGLLLGWKQILFAMVLGCVIGVVIHGLRMVLTKKEHMLAFGPYLAMGIYIMFMFGNTLIEWYVNTFIKLNY